MTAPLVQPAADQEAVDPAKDTPCCPVCGGEVEEVAEGWAKGLYECADAERQACDRYFRHDELAWRA